MKIQGRAVQILVGAVALVCVPFRYQISLGLILGFASSELFNRLLEMRVDAILGRGQVSLVTFIAPLAGTAVLALPMVAAFVYPQHISWIGVLAGLIVSKAALYLVTFASKPSEALNAD